MRAFFWEALIATAAITLGAGGSVRAETWDAGAPAPETDPIQALKDVETIVRGTPPCDSTRQLSLRPEVSVAKRLCALGAKAKYRNTRKIKLDTATLETRVARLSSQLLTQLKKHQQVMGLTEAALARAEERLKGLQIVTQAPAQGSMREQFFRSCGKTLKEVGAFTVKTAEKGTALLICPELSRALDGSGDPEAALDWILAHELGHVVTASGENGIPGLILSDRAMQKAHAGLLSCLDKNFGSGLKSFEQVEATYMPVLERKLETDPNAAFGSAVQSVIESAQDYSVRYKNLLGHTPSAIESHADELMEDYWATQVIVGEMTTKPTVDAVASHMALFCKMLEVKDVFPSDGDEGMHPPHAFRIENFLRHPAIREALKASPLGPSVQGPWCDL